MISKTLSPENQYKIVCPVFGAETRIAACFELRDRVWRGEKLPVRAGCQVALHASKCPINNIIKRMVQDGSDPYHSVEPRLGSLDQDDLDRIARVLVPEKAIAERCSPAEQKKLLEANENARKGVVIKRTRTKTEAAPMSDVPTAAPVAPAPARTTPSAISEAAMTGDMSAAINAEIQSLNKGAE